MNVWMWTEIVVGLLIVIAVVVSLNGTHRFCEWCGHTLPAEHDHNRCDGCEPEYWR